MKSAEEIAREAAESLVTVEWYEPYAVWNVLVGGVVVARHNPEAVARERAERLRPGVSGVVLVVIEEDRRQRQQLPVPSPVSDERLGEIWAWAESPNRAATARERYRDLKAHVGFFEALVRDLSADGATAIYRQGWEAGIELTKKFNDDWYGRMSADELKRKYGITGKLPSYNDMLEMLASGEITHRG